MTTGQACLRGVRVAAAAFLVLTVAVTGCGRPDDEAWLRCLGFKQSGETISVLEGDLNDETSTMVDVELENGSINIGKTTGTGILVNRTRVDYRMSGFSPPSADFPVNLYLSPPAENAPTTGTLAAFPLASKSLKQWLIDAGVGDPVVQLTARVTFYGVTDEGAQIETEASLGIELTNSGGGVTPPTVTKPTVSIAKLNDGKLSTLHSGKFRVSRSDTSSNNLTIVFSRTGLIPGTDYEDIGTSVVIIGGGVQVDLLITPISGGNTGTVTYTLLNNNDTYIIDPSKTHASLTIVP